MTEKVLGKIKHARFGFGGYQDAMFGLSLSFSMNGSGINDFINGGWSMPITEHTKWTEEDRGKQQAVLCTRLIKILNEAKVNDVTKLVGIPVEVEIENMSLKSWRILTEVI